MIARLTRLMILFQLLTLALIAILLKQFEVLASWPLAVLSAALMLILLRASVIFNNFFLSRALRQPAGNGALLGVATTASMMLQELALSLLCWFRLFPLARPYSHLVASDRAYPVLLLHGYGANSGFWHQLHRRLQVEGISHAAIDLEPILGDIDDYAGRIESAAAQLRQANQVSQVIVIAHSMGGLAARAWLRRYGRHGLARLITLGTPHAGSLLAGYGIGVNARQMLPASAWRPEEKHWLSELAASEDAAARALCLCLWSRQDNIVAPQDSGALPGADNIALDGIGHVALGFDERVMDVVMKEVVTVRRSKSTAENR